MKIFSVALDGSLSKAFWAVRDSCSANIATPIQVLAYLSAS
jgi:hypothetical protein